MRLLLSLLVAASAFAARPVQEINTGTGVVEITPIRHASLMIEAGGKVIDVDPWSQGSYDGLPPADLILITDIHGDHSDQPAIAKVKKSGTQFIAPAAVAKTVTEAKVIGNGESTTWDKWSIEAVPMYNLKRGPSEGKFYHDKGRGDGYLLTLWRQALLHRRRYRGHLRNACAQEYRSGVHSHEPAVTMTPEEAADAVRAFHPKIVYPYHYRGSDTQAFKQSLDGSGIDVRLVDWYY